MWNSRSDFWLRAAPGLPLPLKKLSRRNPNSPGFRHLFPD
jgi:hypothetical protein